MTKYFQIIQMTHAFDTIYICMCDVYAYVCSKHVMKQQDGIKRERNMTNIHTEFRNNTFHFFFLFILNLPRCCHVVNNK